MIKNGRDRHSEQFRHKPESITHVARLTAILGVLVFTVFLCTSVERAEEIQDVSGTFGEGAYQVFAPVGGNIDIPDDAIAENDGSIWSYLESVIARLIYGEP